ncbi:hypothetical protein ASA1KI_31230 [Opitutales bacterium ASA1]|uniref:YXWGXW repeat-containing protein n=1 Tax=Congregicoccus parvus TaxID=3081749 RepID=UPI002B29A981|nr:hypothetical protein ASA1KI_31230 [Opitutales bacterium ASA1]
MHSLTSNYFPGRASLRGSFSLSAAAACVALLAGCASGPSSRVVSAPPPGAPPAVAAQPVAVQVPATRTPTVADPRAPATEGAVIVVQQMPPTPPAESPTARPSSRHVWVAGYWSWTGGRYEWVRGQWVVPPVAGATWVPPRWEPEGTGYRFYDGYWD